jgi:hypothetical protein
MAVSVDNVLSSIRGAFNIFVFGERHIDEFLERYPFDRDRVTQQWEMFDALNKNFMDFLRERFPALWERNRSICCELQMYQLREKIEWNERKYECYCSIVERRADCPPILC